MYINTKKKVESTHIDMNKGSTASPTRIFPENDFIINHSIPITHSFKSNYINLNKDKDKDNNKTNYASFDFMKKPKRVNQFNQISKDMDQIKSNTENNRFSLQRSKSLPFNSLKLKSNLKQSNDDNNKLKHHKRSKSVHFDEVLPVKIFSKFECPTVVSRQNSDCDIYEKINFDQVKPLRRYQYDDEDADDDDEQELNQDGLFDVNFNILNNNNTNNSNKDIKLNVFVNSESDSNIILQNIKLEKRKTYNNLNDYFIWGKINVKNFFYEKCIYVRYTFNDWKTFNEVKAVYINDDTNQALNGYDTFQFSLYSVKNLILNENEHLIKKDNIIEGDLQFCIHYETGDSATNQNLEFWNNNNKKNYYMRVVLLEKDTTTATSTTTTSISTGDSQFFKTDKYYNIANELGGFNTKNNKFGKYKNSFALSNEQKKLHSTFLDDLLNNDNIDISKDDSEIIDDDESPFWFNKNNITNNNNNILLTTNKNNDEEIFFKDFRNPFAN